MAILVTGGAGYIGSHMVHELADAGEPVVVLDNLSTGRAASLPKSVPLITGNTGDRALTAKLIAEHRIDAIIHFAASIVVPDSVRDPLGYYRNNTMNTCLLLESAVAGGVKHFIFSSTAAVYGNPDKVPISEDAPTHPVSPYGSSKLMSETLLHDTAQAHGLRFVALRYFNVAGADPKLRTGQSSPGATHLIKVAAETVAGKRQKVSIYGTDYPTPDGTCIRDYIHVSDLVRAHSAALSYLRKGGANATYNCGYGRGASVREVLAAVKRVSGADFPVEVAERREGDPVSLIADVTRIRASLDWKPQYDDLDTIVKHALGWERCLLAESTQK
ncbi:MAG: UDP-glucose 4-epimerase GalE [Hyphomicrobiales bacterium]